MDFSLEKAEIIKRVEKVQDASLLNALKNLLDFGLSKQSEYNAELEDSIERALEQSKQGKVKPHGQAMSEIRAKYRT